MILKGERQVASGLSQFKCVGHRDVCVSICPDTQPELRAFPSQGGTTYISTVHKLRSILSLLSFYRLFIQSQNLRHPQQNTEGMLSVFTEHVGTMSLIGRFVQVRFPEGSSSHSF